MGCERREALIFVGFKTNEESTKWSSIQRNKHFTVFKLQKWQNPKFWDIIKPQFALPVRDCLKTYQLDVCGGSIVEYVFLNKVKYTYYYILYRICDSVTSVVLVYHGMTTKTLNIRNSEDTHTSKVLKIRHWNLCSVLFEDLYKE
jgi:hypothetical protein